MHTSIEPGTPSGRSVPGRPALFLGIAVGHGAGTPPRGTRAGDERQGGQGRAPSKTVPWLMETDIGALDVDVMVTVTCRNEWEKVAFMRAIPLRMAQYSQVGSLVTSCKP